MSKLWKIEHLGQDRRLIFAVFLAETAVLALMRLPTSLNFFGFAPFDTGRNLTAEYLYRHGYRAGIDFSYYYGLLGLLAGHFWFGLAGLTPWSYEVANWLISLFIVWGLVRVAIALRAGLLGVLLFALTMPILVFTQYLSFSHALEAAFIVHALAAQAAGNRPQALIWATLAVLAKPALGLFYGAFLLGLVVLVLYQRNKLTWHGIIEWIGPSVAVAVVASLILAIYFGLGSLRATILPFTGARAYAVQGFGFFGSGESFWWPHWFSLAYYFESIAGFYIFATILLFGAALFVCLLRIASNREILLTCALLQLIFIVVLWGNQFSWIYYSYLPIIGLASAIRLGRVWRCAILACALLMPGAKFARVLIIHLEPIRATHNGGRRAAVNRDLDAVSQSSLSLSGWFDSRRGAATAGLWATAPQRDEWLKALAFVRGKPAAVLEPDGCTPLLYPALFMPPVALHLIAGLSVPGEISRTLDQVGRADVLVFPAGLGPLRDVPEVGALVDADFQPVFRGTYVVVYARKQALPPAGEAKSRGAAAARS
ncbi:MAG TPA: hypothetical protein VKV28_10040 [Candidatus Binataceae bacterium]|nr:hypothetical protein [Candidatus Binataceae bacterium]